MQEIIIAIDLEYWVQALNIKINYIMITKDEILQLEYKTLMEQYKASRDEMNGLLSSSRQIITLVFTVISVFTGIAIYFKTNTPLAFLFLSLFICMVTWVQLRYILLIRRLSAYISNVISPRIQVIFKELSGNDNLLIGDLLSWEKNWQSPGKNIWKMFLFPVLGSGFGIPLLVSLLIIIFYFKFIPDMATIDWTLIILNIIAIIYSSVLGFLIEYNKFGMHYKRTNK